jgi:hypothetical protein
MDKIGERLLVYIALLVICTGAGAMLGLSAGLWTFVQVAAVVEVTYWLCKPVAEKSASDLATSKET